MTSNNLFAYVLTGTAGIKNNVNHNRPAYVAELKDPELVEHSEATYLRVLRLFIEQTGIASESAMLIFASASHQLVIDVDSHGSIEHKHFAKETIRQCAIEFPSHARCLQSVWENVLGPLSAN
jgi:hypothetical protein